MAIPITGLNACDGKEYLFGYNLECEHCQKKPKIGDTIVEVKTSGFKQLFPQTVAINYIVKEA